jgi:hypothetical protein
VTITTYDGAGHGIQRPRDPEHPMPAYLDQITPWAQAQFDGIQPQARAPRR